jgi:oligopeptide/dipeptide ABC transporter ATP-binding protein
MGGRSILAVTDLHTYFFTPRGVVRAVDGASFELGAGEAIGIVGESGSGKSVTALSIAGLVPAPGRVVSGTIELDGRDLHSLDARAMQSVRANEIAMIFQDPGSYLNPVMTIGEQIAEAIGRRRARDFTTRKKVIDALRDVQIPEPDRVAASYPHELSGGMQQRAMIATALIRHPRVIIADEPTTALDATVQHQILKLLAALRAGLRISLILISHDLAVIRSVCDRVYVMYAGQVVEEGPTAETFAAPKHPYTRALVDSILDPWEPKAELAVLPGAPPDMASPPPGCRFHPRCSQAKDICRRREPPTVRIGDGRQARCWLHATEEATA